MNERNEESASKCFRESTCNGEIVKDIAVEDQIHDDGSDLIRFFVLFDVLDRFKKLHKIYNVCMFESGENLYFFLEILEIKRWVTLLDYLYGVILIYIWIQPNLHSNLL